jgi:LmbE family N-acetylglucosaminyl deacetylase
MSQVLFLSPHSDDEALFGSFIIQQELPEVWVITDGVIQQNRGEDVRAGDRREESCNGVSSLIKNWPVHFGGMSDSNVNWNTVSDLLVGMGLHGFDRVYAPYPETHESCHDHHNKLGFLVTGLFPEQVRFYATYTRQTGKTGPSTPRAREYPPTDGGQVQRKLRALSCYRSQMDVHNCREHFMRDLREYVVDYRPGEMWWEVIGK